MFQKILIFLLLLIICSNLFGQGISYDVPERFKNDVTTNSYKIIVDKSILEISKHEKVISVVEGMIKTDKNKGFGLDNLVYKCKNENNESSLTQIIKEHFDALFGSMNLSDSIDYKNFEKIKPYLSLRIYPKDYFEQYLNPQNAIYKTDLEGTYTVLMLDLPTAFTNVQKDSMFDFWKKTIEIVFEIAQQNVNQQKVEKLTQSFDLGGTNMEINFIADETYGASYALDLVHNSPDFVGDFGSVVAFPNKGIVNICKITKSRPLDFVKFIQGTKNLVQKFYEEHPYPISTNFFWYHDGIFTKINVTQESDGKVNVFAPQKLSELLMKLK